MSNHITETQFEGFVLQTLTDAEREHIKRHTANCPPCRATLQEREFQLRRIQYELQTELRQARPSPQMNFTAIASDIPRLRRFTMFQQTSTRVLAGVFMLAVLVIGFTTLNNFWQQSAELSLLVPDAPDTGVTTGTQTSIWLSDGRSIPGWYTTNVHLDWQEMTTVSSDYEVGIDTAVSYQGDHSGTIRSRVDDPKGSSALRQTIQADAYRGQRIRAAVFLKSEQVDGNTLLDVVVYDDNGSFVNRGQNASFTGTQDWQQQEIVIDVPGNSAYLSFGASLEGSGQVWVDDWTIEVVSSSVPVTADRSAPHNLGLESAADNNTPQHWFLSGSAPQDYQISLDDSTFTEGQTSVLLQSDTAQSNEFGTLMQGFVPDAFRGQRVRLTADVKSEDALQVMPWMRVDGPRGQTLQIDNNDDQFLTGTVDWTPYEIVLDVPEESTGISFGLIVGGSGRGWIDNVQLEVVGADVPTTNNQDIPLSYEAPLRTKLQPEGSSRISTPLSGWFEPETQPAGYETGEDTAVSSPDSDSPSVYIRSNRTTAGSGDLIQTISAQNYRGQRISLTLYLQGEAISGQAMPWLRIDSVYGTIAKANVGSLALSGSQEWTPYELVLDVPDEATVITLGVSLQGGGTVWIGDVQLETVSDAVPTTNLFDAAAPINLGFEE
jgi:hypothetical protein